MFRSQWELTCKGSHRRPAANPIALALAGAADLVTKQAQSTLHCPRKPTHAASSRLVVNGIVFEGRTLWLPVPDSNGTWGSGLENDLAHGVPHERRDALPLSRSRRP